MAGVQEQHDLVPRQFSRVVPETSVYDGYVYYQYTEYISKNNQHRFKDLNSSSKITRAYAQVDSRHCVVKLLDTYLAKLHPEGSLFYMRPLESLPVDESKPWYTKQQVGVNKLKEVMPMLSKEAGCKLRYTNHSLRATVVTRMFSGGVPEKLIAEKSGHQSLTAFRRYEKTGTIMEKSVDAVISNPESSFLIEKDTWLGKSHDEYFYNARKQDDEKGSSVTETKEDGANPGKEPKVPIAHTFSVNLSNCTINISYH